MMWVSKVRQHYNMSIVGFIYITCKVFKICNDLALKKIDINVLITQKENL